MFFGYYGIVKSIFERLPKRSLEWLFKCLSYTASFLILYFFLKEAFASLTDLIPLGILPVYGIGLVCFILYDIGFSRLIGLYLRRIKRNFGGEEHRDKSMTGYGRAVETIGNKEITVELRSVNNRYLDCTVKLPRIFAFAEDAVKRKIKEQIQRGKVDVSFPSIWQPVRIQPLR